MGGKIELQSALYELMATSKITYVQERDMTQKRAIWVAWWMKAHSNKEKDRVEKRSIRADERLTSTVREVKVVGARRRTQKQWVEVCKLQSLQNISYIISEEMSCVMAVAMTIFRASRPAIPLWRDNGARWKWGDI